MHARLTLLLLLLISAAAFAPVTVEPLDLRFAVPIIAIIVAIFLGLMNMMSISLGDPRFQAWTKAELREYVAGLVLIVIVTVASLGSTGVSVALTGNDDYVEASLDAIDGWISSYDTSFDYVIRAGTKVRAAATYSPYMNIAIYWFSISYSANPIGGIAIVLISLNMAAQGLANVTFIYEGLRLLVLYLKVTIPTAFLPLAFIIRLIPFTRKVGNTLIALALAGIVFLPFSILLVESMHNVMGDGFPSPRISNMPGLDANPWAMVVAEPLCESATIRTILSLTDPLFAIIVCLPLLLIPIAGPGLFNACKPVLEYVVYPLLQVVFQIVMTVIMIAWFIAFAIQMAMPGGGYAGDVFDALYPFLMDVNNLVLMGYLDFVLIAIVTFAGARGLSSALGGEWYMAGVQRLI